MREVKGAFICGVLFFLIVILNGNSVYGWTNEEMEMYDLVEELGQNFYEVLGVSSQASSKEIKSAYRKLSVITHPDKNDAPDASVKFRQLVGVYEVLKNKDLRLAYDQVLIDGLPNWRQPLFYFRRARKFALWQVALIIITIVSLGQYLAGWASYFEQKLAMNEQVQGKLKKTLRTRKAQKANANLADKLDAEIDKLIPKPSLFDTAPFQLFRLGKYMIFSMPGDIIAYIVELKKQREEEERRKKEEEEERLEEERRLAEEAKKPKKRKVATIPVKNEEEEYEGKPVWGGEEDSKAPTPKKQYIRGGLWTDDDIGELAQLCSKYPGGTPDRWEKIADILERPTPEVIHMAKTVLEKLSQKANEEAEEAIAQPKVKVKTKGGGGGGAEAGLKSVESWTVDEQKSLENALQKFPKGALDRWDKIANMIPTRNKDECMQRYKYVADLVKKKKEAEEESSQSSSADPPPPIPKEEIKQSTEESSPKPKEFSPAPSPKKTISQDKGVCESVPTLQKVLAEAQNEEEEEETSSKEVLKDSGSGELKEVPLSNSSSSSDNDWCIVEDPPLESQPQ